MPDRSFFQHRFHRRWGHLHDAHVRDMAWLLDSPDLLDAAAPQWHGRIASLSDFMGPDVERWLVQLDRDPSALHELISTHAYNRLGRYSELLIAFFLRHLGILHAHGLQVRAGKNETLGEFDFLLWDARAGTVNTPGLVHWEFATKFYLLEPDDGGSRLDSLVGPNLADTLGAKMRKILERQLVLSRHPAAQALLPQAVVSAQALIKGWLFYPVAENPPRVVPGVAPDHCRGFWSPLSELGAKLDAIGHERFIVLPRLHWLAPARASSSACLDLAALSMALHEHFLRDTQPVMIALMEPDGEHAVEVERGFIVPDDWAERASQFVRIN